ncbi:ImpE protein [Anatilimnocola aggregata]|uniref:ImpE protein n=1 Tax=Anatilimnocola aggregata TaxID=2528021 RepID=A0A517Y4W8_9BACT|nr:type VI secretion system accessory protein TagJ [Anatilimnocola aggregata]QDU25275.1 ImpE protein [Anatilimnocola aggregata]
MDAKQAFDAGKLREAIDAQVQKVKGAPGDTRARTFLFELLCFAGEWDRANKQLDALSVQEAGAAWGVSVYQNLLAAEKTRQKVFSEGVKPETFIEQPPFLSLHLDAISRLREGNGAAATALLEQSAALQTPVKGELNGQGVSGLRNADDLLAPILEVMVMRDYVWVPWQQVQSLTVMIPQRPRDLIWAAAKLTLTDGIQRSCYLPALYTGSSAADNDEAKLGRLTEWVGLEGGPARGLGQHLLMVGDGDIGLLEVRTFTAGS